MSTNAEYLPNQNPYNSLKFLNKSINKLKKKQHIKSGLSKDFQHKMKAIEITMSLCKKSMGTLANEYVEQLSLFQKENLPIKALEALDSSEKIWKKESCIIRRLDPSGKENAFLNKMREHTLTVLENKLIELSKNRSRKLSDQNAALSLGILGTMDVILNELHYVEDSPTRQRLSRIAKGFLR